MHGGKVIAKKEDYKVIDCVKCGFAHLYPFPSVSQLAEFYQKKYYDLIKKGGRAPELRRQMQVGSENELEMKWLKATLYQDIDYILKSNLKPSFRRILDIGSGKGEFLRYMNDAGWNVAGIEPDEKSTDAKLNIQNMTLEDFALSRTKKDCCFDVITVLSVLEHVPNPKEFLKTVRILLNKKHGVVCIRVPNDFSILQLEAQKKIKKLYWWVAVPDHLNYFTMASLKRLIQSTGFDILYSTSDFPMEFFLLMGDDYVADSQVGPICHKKRVNLEMSIPSDLRRKMYQGMADLGMGRDCMIFAKIKK